MQKVKLGKDALTQNEQETLRNWLNGRNIVLAAKMMGIDFRTMLLAAAGQTVRPSSIHCIRTKLAEIEC